MFLFKNGKIWDGERFFYGDVLTDGAVIAAIGPDLPPEKATVLDCTGRIISAGLVDCHIHFHGLSSPQYGISGEVACFPFGVTAAVDAGSFLGNREILSHIRVKNAVFAQSKYENGHLNREVTLERLTRYQDRALGIKVFFDSDSPGMTSIAPLQEAAAFAREQGVGLTVHCNGSPTPMWQIVETLCRGDILTHVYHGGNHTCLEEDFAAFRLAREKGVIMDAGFAGHVHTDFAVFRRAIAAGCLPDTISTDITCRSAFCRGGRYGMTLCMSMARTAGMSEEAIFPRVTTAPAKALGQSQWGRLKVGGAADLAVLEYTDEGFSLTDKAGNCLESKTGYRCMLTLSDGKIVHRFL